MHSTSDNRKFTPYSDANEVIDELFEVLHLRYQWEGVVLFLIQFN